MKASTVIAVAAGLTAYTVSAQIDQLPQCALNCALTSLGTTGCPNTDFACICNASSFIASLLPCVQSGCSAAELETTVQAATALCLAAGVTLTVPTGGAPSSTTEAPSSSSSVSVTTETSSTTETMVVEPPMNTTITTSTDMPTPTGNGTTTEVTPPSPSGTEGSSASRNAVTLGGLGALVAFVAALL